MSKGPRITLVVLLLAVVGVGVVVWAVLKPNEPVYEGRLLTSWLRQYAENHQFTEPDLMLQPRGELGKQAEAAIRQIGTNAIPTLLQMVQASDPPPWKLRLIEFLRKQSIIKINRASPSLAALGFTALGADAAGAVPALIEVCEGKYSKQAEHSAACSLAAIGPPAKAAVPTLMRGMANSSMLVRLYSITALGRIHANPEIVVPALINCLKDNRAGMTLQSAYALGTFGADAKQAIPILIESLESPDADLRECATNALKLIDPQAAAKAGVK